MKQSLTVTLRVIGVLATVVMLLAALAILREGITVGGGHASDAEYGFGGESVSTGGWAYRSPAHFLVASLVEGSPLLFRSVALLIGAIRGRARPAIAGACLTAISLAAIAFRLLRAAG